MEFAAHIPAMGVPLDGLCHSHHLLRVSGGRGGLILLLLPATYGTFVTPLETSMLSHLSLLKKFTLECLSHTVCLCLTPFPPPP